jgi:hypothetical protein
MQPQPLTDTFIEAVRYIYYNRRKIERPQINTYLLNQGHNPTEIEQAWQAVLSAQGWYILQGKNQYKPLPNPAFLQVVEYIQYNVSKQERIQIDRRLLDLGHSPTEIDRAWKIVSTGQGWKIIKEAKKAANKRKLTPFEQFISDAIGGCLLLCLGGFVIFGSFLGLFYVGGWLDSRVGLPPFLVVPLVIVGFVITFGSIIFTSRALAKHKPIAGLGVLFIILQFIGFFGAFVSMMGPPNPLPPFAPYPNATALSMPVPDQVRKTIPINIYCTDEHLYLDPKEIFATTDTSQTIWDFYSQQAQSIGKKGLSAATAEMFIGDRNVKVNNYPSATDSAVCYLGGLERIYRPANAIIILNAHNHENDLKDLFPNIPANTTNIVFVFNGVLSRGYI